MRRLVRQDALAPVVVAVLVGMGYALGFGGWGRVWNLAIAAGAAGWIAWKLRGRWRDGAVSIAAILFTLAGVEAVAIALQPRPIDRNTAGYSVSHTALGWAPGAPGVYHHVKRRADGTLIFDARYTIGPGQARVVTSAETGAPVVFLGDSTTFGTGVNDAETLPQQFADATGRRLPVRNLAMSGYGPQQVLSVVETKQGQYLKGSRALVFQTAAFHAERSSCWASFMLRAPRYVLVDGVPTYQGPCYGDWWVAVRSLFVASATYQQFVAPLLGKPTRAEMDLYIAILIRAGERARTAYGAPLVILYMPRPGDYLSRAGMTETDVMDRLRAGGLTVIDGYLDPKDFPGQPLAIPGDGHPTGTANRARAALLARGLALPP